MFTVIFLPANDVWGNFSDIHCYISSLPQRSSVIDHGSNPINMLSCQIQGHLLHQHDLHFKLFILYTVSQFGEFKLSTSCNVHRILFRSCFGLIGFHSSNLNNFIFVFII